MKKALLICIVLLAGCTATTKITGSWRNPNAASKEYNNIFVQVMSGDNVARSSLENALQDELGRYGIKTEKSMEEFPPNLKDSTSRQTMIQKMRDKGSQAVLTVNLLRKETESRYVGGGYYPMSMYGYYGNFWGYYNYWYPYVYAPGYYSYDQVYYIETNLYDINNSNLIWSAQTQTYDYDGLKEFYKEFARLTADRMKSDGVIRNGAIKNGYAKE